MESGSLPVVRIADDGELGDVRKLLEQLGVEWVDGDVESERPTALLIATPRLLVGTRSGGGQVAASAGFCIVVADKMTNGLQRELERVRPDFLVMRPFHPAALRLLITHALYVGPERRGSARIALTAAIRFRTSVFSRGATLIELSRGGCRLIGERVPAPGESVTVILPRELTGDAVVSLGGRVVGADPAGGFEPGEQACSVAFDGLDNQKRRALRAIMTNRAFGGASLAPRTDAQAGASQGGLASAAQNNPAAARASRASAKKTSERRRSPRRAYTRSVLASSGGAARILIGRDLSQGGMRVAADADLIVGDALKLVVYGPAGRPPLLLQAVVSRNDGADGCVLQFQDVAPRIAAELAEWTTLLPGLDPSDHSTHSIVSEVVEDEAESGGEKPAGEARPKARKARSKAKPGPGESR